VDGLARKNIGDEKHAPQQSPGLWQLTAGPRADAAREGRGIEKYSFLPRRGFLGRRYKDFVFLGEKRVIQRRADMLRLSIASMVAARAVRAEFVGALLRRVRPASEAENGQSDRAGGVWWTRQTAAAPIPPSGGGLGRGEERRGEGHVQHVSARRVQAQPTGRTDRENRDFGRGPRSVPNGGMFREKNHSRAGGLKEGYLLKLAVQSVQRALGIQVAGRNVHPPRQNVGAAICPDGTPRGGVSDSRLGRLRTGPGGFVGKRSIPKDTISENAIGKPKRRS